MARLSGPLFSEKAQKQLGHNLIYKRKGNKNILTKYNKPGGVNPFNPSPTQINQRMIYNLIIANWQVKNTAEKKVFDDLAKSKNLKMSGWNYFLREATADLPTYLGLQGYWAFNRIVAGKYQDISGNANHGTPMPSYPSNYPEMVDSINRKFGKAGSFDGIDDYVNCGEDSSLDVDYITVEAWVKYAILPGTLTHVIASRDNGERSFAFYHFNTNTFRFFVFYTSTLFAIKDTTWTPTVGQWYHIVGTADGSNVRIYINGVDVGLPEAYTGIMYKPIATNVRIGVGKYPGYFNGLIDEVRIYNRALGPEEIKKHYDLIF